jgi:3-phenylpropionate/trans-cinnamate dioxygenase ferredoxin component
MPEFRRLCLAADIPPGKMKRCEVDELPVAIYNCAGTFYATHDTCTHAEASLAEGFLDCGEHVVECPLHGARFDIKTGKALSMPAFVAVKTYPVKVEAGAIFVAV